MKIGDPPSESASILVIGYGNDLRGDDGAGRRVAAAVSEWGSPGVKALSVHQLTPELAEPISAARLVLFVDAYVASDRDGVQTLSLEPEDGCGPRLPSMGGVGHFGDPQKLLTLSRAVYGRRPEAWWIIIPAIRFDFSETLSTVAERGVACALQRIKERIEATGE